jgi:hypothetical protein
MPAVPIRSIRRSRRALVHGALWAKLLSVTASNATATARGSVRIDARAAIVRTSAGAAIVYRSPFRVVFTDARGRRVLSETPAAGQRRRLTAPARPLAPGYGPPLQPTLYAPLEFTVGAERDLTHSSGTWSGDLLASVRLGSVFSAARVRSAFRVGAGRCAPPGPCGGRWEGVRVVASTTDPSGRKLIVTIAPTVDGALRVRVRPSPAAGVAGSATPSAPVPARRSTGSAGAIWGSTSVARRSTTGPPRRTSTPRTFTSRERPAARCCTPTAPRRPTTRRRRSSPRGGTGSCSAIPSCPLPPRRPPSSVAGGRRRANPRLHRGARPGIARGRDADRDHRAPAAAPPPGRSGRHWTARRSSAKAPPLTWRRSART